MLLADKALNAVVTGKTTPYIEGYERKMEIDGLRIWLLYSRLLWMSDSSVETPFWVALGELEQQDSEIYQKVTARISEHKQDYILSLIHISTDAAINNHLLWTRLMAGVQPLGR